MQNSRNRKLGAIAVAVVALAGVGTAYAASKLHSSSTQRGCSRRFRSARRRAVRRAPVEQRLRPRVRGRPFDGRGFGLGGPGGSFTAAATYLGISQAQLFTDIRSGKTLAQIANSTSGKSASGLIDAMVAAEKTELDAAVKSGRITQAMADQIEANLKARVTQMVNNGFGRFGGRGGGNGFGSPPSTPPTLGGSSPL